MSGRVEGPRPAGGPETPRAWSILVAICMDVTDRVIVTSSDERRLNHKVSETHGGVWSPSNRIGPGAVSSTSGNNLRRHLRHVGREQARQLRGQLRPAPFVFVLEEDVSVGP